MRRYKVGKEIFHEFDDAVKYMELEGYSVEDIEELDDNPESLNQMNEKIPDEKTAKTPIQWLRSQKDKGSEPITERHQSNELPAYKENLNTNNYLREFVLRGIEAIKQDPSLPSCPYCSESWSKIESDLAPEHREQLAVYAGKPLKFKDAPTQENQYGGVRNQNRQYSDAKIPLKIQHLKTKHVGIYKMLRDAKIVMQFEGVTDDYRNTILKPTNKRNTENLSETELAKKIQENPELRKQFYRRWIESLQR